MTEPTASPDVTELIERLCTHALGPKTCQDCGRDRADPDTTLCRQEGQCDFIRHNGTHTSAIDDPWKFKEDVLVAADVLLALRQEVERLTRERNEARELAQLFSQADRKPDWIARADAAEASLRLATQRLEDVVEALRPFAECADQVDENSHDLQRTNGWTFQARDFRRASAVFRALHPKEN